MKRKLKGGYGRIRELALDVASMNEFTKGIDGRGEFVTKRGLKSGVAGHIVSGSLEGAMFEYENVFVVAWSCGEYIDVGVFDR